MEEDDDDLFGSMSEDEDDDEELEEAEDDEEEEETTEMTDDAKTVLLPLCPDLKKRVRAKLSPEVDKTHLDSVIYIVLLTIKSLCDPEVISYVANEEKNGKMLQPTPFGTVDLPTLISTIIEGSLCPEDYQDMTDAELNRLVVFGKTLFISSSFFYHE